MNAYMTRFLATTLLMLLAPAAAATDYIRVVMGTGGDDLRGGNDNVHITVFANDGRVIGRAMNANGRQRQADNTFKHVGIRLEGATADDIGAIELETTFTGGIGGDNWNLDSLRVTPQGNTREVIFEARGAPLFRFTGEQRIRRFTVLNHQCRVNADCDNRNPADGTERCVATPRRLDAQPLRACVAGPRPACATGTTWSDRDQACIAPRRHTDLDGDGVDSIADGGSDCDDTDARRFPGNIEICDELGRDEDCDFETGGRRDSDGDGHDSNMCFNWGPPLRR